MGPIRTKRPVPTNHEYEYEYIRRGTQFLIAAFDIKTGNVIAKCGDTRTAEDLLTLMEEIAKVYTDDKKIHVIWDNLAVFYYFIVILIVS